MKILLVLILFFSFSLATAADETFEVTSSDIRELKLARQDKSEQRLLEAVFKILGKDPKNYKALSVLGVYYLESNKLGLAKIIFERALKDHDKESSLHNNLGVMYIGEGDIRKAVASFRRALDLDGGNDIAAANLSSIYLKHKDYAKATDPLEEAYKKTRSDLSRGDLYSVQIANNYALALAGSGKPKKAADIFEEILKGTSKDINVMLNYAIILVEDLNEQVDAIKVINKIKFITENKSVLKRVSELEKTLKDKSKK